MTLTKYNVYKSFLCIACYVIFNVKNILSYERTRIHRMPENQYYKPRRDSFDKITSMSDKKTDRTDYDSSKRYYQKPKDSAYGENTKYDVPYGPTKNKDNDITRMNLIKYSKDAYDQYYKPETQNKYSSHKNLNEMRGPKEYAKNQKKYSSEYVHYPKENHRPEYRYYPKDRHIDEHGYPPKESHISMHSYYPKTNHAELKDASRNQIIKENQGISGKQVNKGLKKELGITKAERSPISKQISGPPGENGLPGSPGISGKPGDQGMWGVKGNPGERGSTGDTGKRGSTGDPGIPGMTGPLGSSGRSGKKGSPGIPGERGDYGRSGTNGSPGKPGEQGKTGLTGNLGPSGAQGLTGNPGPAGSQGTRGLVGKQGLLGPIGKVGPKGERGQAGGEIGPNGLPGKPGLDGKMGPKGDKGDLGTEGEKGDKGEKGIPGTAVFICKEYITDESKKLCRKHTISFMPFRVLYLCEGIVSELQGCT